MSRWKGIITNRLPSRRWKLQQECTSNEEAEYVKNEWNAIVKSFEYKRVGNKIYRRLKKE